MRGNRKQKMDEELHGFYNDNGTPVHPDLIPKPGLCLTCKHDEDSRQYIPCTLNRMDQREEEDFICDAYEEKG